MGQIKRGQHIFLLVTSERIYKTRSSAVAESPRDASYLSVVGFNIDLPTSQFFLLSITAASDLLVHKILLWFGYPMVKIF